MFVLVVEAGTAAPDLVRDHVFSWPDEVGRRAAGWLGNTAGVSADGEFVMLMRFESEETAYITSDLPEYSRWWEGCRQRLDREPTFSEATRVSGILAGGSDDARAVRILRGRSRSARFRDGLARLESLPARRRAGVIGGIVAWHDDDRITEALYFRSPTAIRRPPSHAEPTELQRVLELQEAAVVRKRVVDLGDPWLFSPPRRVVRPRQRRRSP